MQPVLLAFAATLLGLVFAPVYVFPPLSGTISLLLLSVLGITLRKWRKTGLFVVFALFFILANLRYSSRFPPRPDILHLNQLAKKVTLSGHVDDIRQLTDGRSWLTVDVTSVEHKGRALPLAGPLEVRLYLGEGTNKIFPGDTIRCRTRLRKPRLFGIPGEFNWPRYLTGQHVDMTGWVKSGEKIAVADSSAGGIRRAIVQWRTRVAAKIHTLMPDERAWLVRSLVLGEGRVIPDDLRRILARSGISHLFAISGLHLGMIAFLGYFVLQLVYRRIPQLLGWQPPQRILPLVLLPLLLSYLLLTGDAVSTRRAFALAVCGAVFIHWRYHVNPLQLLASLAMMSLLVNPLLLWQASWQLSFSGAAGILLWQPLWQHIGAGRPRFLRYLLQLFLVTGSASLATLPFVLANFHLLAPAGMIANLVCVPLVTLLALPAGFLGLLFEPFVSPLSSWLFLLCGSLLDSIVRLAGWLTTLPGLSGHSLFLSRWQYLAVALFILPLLLVGHLNRRMFLQLGVVALFLGTVLWQLPFNTVSSLSLTMFSVGQGEALLLQNRAGQSILIDGGGFYSNRFDVGARLLAPAFGELKVRSLDAVVLTHDNIDHRNGLVFVLENFPVKRFLTGIPVTKLHYTLKKVLAERDIPITIVPHGWSHLPFWTGGDLQIFNGASAGCRDNDTSLVMYLDSPVAGGLLLTGDLEAPGVEKLLTAGVPGPVSLLKLPHHGSRFSAVGSLLDSLSPRLCLVSSGYQNRYHLPAREVVEILAERGIPLYRTDLSGTLRASALPSGWQVEYMKKPLFH